MKETKKITGKEVLKTASDSVHELIGSLAQDVLEKQFGKTSDEPVVDQNADQDVNKSTEGDNKDESQFVTKDDFQKFAKDLTTGLSDTLTNIVETLTKSKDGDDVDGEADNDGSDDTATSKPDEDIQKSVSDDEDKNQLTVDEIGSVIAKSLTKQSGRKSFVVVGNNVVDKSLSEVEDGQEIDLNSIDVKEYEKLDKGLQSQMLKSYMCNFIRSK